jgi:hypothetical protein
VYDAGAGNANAWLIRACVRAGVGQNLGDESVLGKLDALKEAEKQYKAMHAWILARPLPPRLHPLRPLPSPPAPAPPAPPSLSPRACAPLPSPPRLRPPRPHPPAPPRRP